MKKPVARRSLTGFLFVIGLILSGLINFVGNKAVFNEDGSQYREPVTMIISGAIACIALSLALTAVIFLLVVIYRVAINKLLKEDYPKNYLLLFASIFVGVSSFGIIYQSIVTHITHFVP